MVETCFAYYNIFPIERWLKTCNGYIHKYFIRYGITSISARRNGNHFRKGFAPLVVAAWDVYGKIMANLCTGTFGMEIFPKQFIELYHRHWNYHWYKMVAKMKEKAWPFTRSKWVQQMKYPLIKALRDNTDAVFRGCECCLGQQTSLWSWYRRSQLGVGLLSSRWQR